MRKNTRGLYVFCSAAQNLSFKNAATDLFLTPSAVSHQISELEEYLGAKLFKRSARSISLTPEGEVFYQKIAPLLNAIDDATENFREAEHRNPLQVQMPEFFASELLMPQIKTFTAKHKEIDLQITGIGISEESNPDADIRILLTRKTPCAQQVARLFAIQYVPVCNSGRFDITNADEEAAVDLIQNSTLLLHKARPHAWTQWADNAGVSRPKSTDVIYVDSMFALARAAERGVGIALLPLPVSQDWLDSGALVALHSKYLVTEDYYWITINGNPNQRKSCLLFFQWMLRTFQKEE